MDKNELVAKNKNKDSGSPRVWLGRIVREI